MGKKSRTVKKKPPKPSIHGNSRTVGKVSHDAPHDVSKVKGDSFLRKYTNGQKILFLYLFGNKSSSPLLHLFEKTKKISTLMIIRLSRISEGL